MQCLCNIKCGLNLRTWYRCLWTVYSQNIRITIRLGTPWSPVMMGLDSSGSMYEQVCRSIDKIVSASRMIFSIASKTKDKVTKY